MLFQATGNPGADLMGALTNFATSMVGLSVASERITETVKQWASPLLSKLSSTGSAATTQVLAVISGVIVTALSGLNPIGVPGFTPYAWTNSHVLASWLVSGIMVSGGSAFWNHILDILSTVKVQRQTVVNAALQAANQGQIPK